MFVLILFCSLIYMLYVVQISLYAYGFQKLKTFKFKTPTLKLEKKLYLSVIIPFKNEETNLPSLIQNLIDQSLSIAYFDVFFIDDNSNDNSFKVAQNFIKGISNFHLISSEKGKAGKKNALKLGISKSSSELIVTSDADCRHQKDWLKQILYFYSEKKPKMIISPVLMTGQSFFQKNQALEFLSLTGSTAGAAGINHPIMCNGANLAFEKGVFFEFEDALNNKEISGDDVFLLHNVKNKYPKDISYLKSKDTVVFTEAESSLKSFFKQRIRWASKSKSYTDFDAILSSLIVFLINILLVGLFSASFFNENILILFISVFSLKTLIDFILLYLTASFFNQKYLLVYFPLLSLLYPFYIVFTAVFSLVSKGVKWKD